MSCCADIPISYRCSSNLFYWDRQADALPGEPALLGVAPTQELVSRTGMIQASLFNHRVGPICRTVRDTTKVLDVIAGYAGYDPSDELTAFSVDQPPQQPHASFTEPQLVDRPLPLKGITVGVIREWDLPWCLQRFNSEPGDALRLSQPRLGYWVKGLSV
jgi:hypothetical protein